MCCPSQDPEDQIKALLLGDERDIERGIELIHRTYAEAIACWIQRGLCSLSPEDLADAWQRTLLCIARMAVNKKFQQDGSLFALLSSVMRRRAIDILNNNTKYQEALEKYREKVTSSAEVTGSDPLFLDELFHLISERIDGLPPKQKIVWEAYRECGFSVRALPELVKAVEKATGLVESEDSVRRARQGGRDKLREYLKRKDYGP